MGDIELTALNDIASKSETAESVAGDQGISGKVSASVAKLKEDIAGSPVDPWRAEKLMAGFVAVEALVEGVTLLNGIGSPDEGSKFSQGHKMFTGDIAVMLTNALPTQWFGDGAQEYRRHHVKQQDCVRAIADADQQTARILTAQASQIEKTRKELAAARETAVAGLAIGGIYYALCKVYRGLPMENIIALQMFWALIIVAFLVTLEILMTLVALIDCAARSQRELSAVMGTYKSVTGGVAAMMATAEVSAIEAPMMWEFSTLRATPQAVGAGLSQRVSQHMNLNTRSAVPARPPVSKTSPVLPADAPFAGALVADAPLTAGVPLAEPTALRWAQTPA